MGPFDPAAVFAATYKAARGQAAVVLFTVTVLDRAAGLARRAYSSHPKDYPVTGTKPIGQGGWSDQVVGRGEVFVANTTAGFAPYFPDHALINALGCHAAMNLPLRGADGLVVATVNLLGPEGAFDADAQARLLALIADRRAALLRAVAEMPVTAP